MKLVDVKRQRGTKGTKKKNEDEVKRVDWKRWGEFRWIGWDVYEEHVV